jgi:hypothetical protein
MSGNEKLIKQFGEKGYVLNAKYRVPSSLLWKPDFILTHSGINFLVLVRSTSTIPTSLLNRIAHTPSDKIVPLLVFQRKLKKQDERVIVSFGISFCHFLNGKLEINTIKKKLSKQKIKQEIRKKLRQIDVFVSSKQEVEEREFIRSRINYLRDTFNYPFSCHLIEYDKFNIDKLYSHIDSVMATCEFVVIVLEDGHSPVVSYEISKAIRTKEPDNIFMFVKSTLDSSNSWKKDLNKVKRLNTVKYLPYADKNDLEVIFSKAVCVRMNAICKKEGVELFI